MDFIDSYENLLKKSPKGKRKYTKIYCGLSGGVDSSVCAYLLKKEGFDVTAIYMQCWGSEDPNCRAHQDRADALRVANFLKIPFKVWDFEDEYKKKVIDYFFSEYKSGNTPNPDIICNQEIKFKLFLEKSLKLGSDFVATGHYAFLLQGLKGHFYPNYFVASGADSSKDQSYFLSRMPIKAMPSTLFPLGKYFKKKVRDIAKRAKIPVALKKDSTGICFLEDINVQDFLKTRIKEKRGTVMDLNGNVIGYHKGVWFYTIGQRHGFNLNIYTGYPLYVVKKDISNNILYVGKKEDLIVNKVYFQDLDLRLSLNLVQNFVKKGLIYARIRNLGEFLKVKKFDVNQAFLSNTVDSVASGQFIVFYYFSREGFKIVIGSAKII